MYYTESSRRKIGEIEEHKHKSGIKASFANVNTIGF